VAGSRGGNSNSTSAIPQAVLQSFTNLFGNVTVQEWSLRNDGTWRAHFLNNGVAWEATFKADGTLVKSEASGANNNNDDGSAGVPTAVLQSFTNLFGNIPVQEWKLRSDGNWRAHFMNNGIAWEATFTPDGTLVKSERA
jgi:hypothetical protein